MKGIYMGMWLNQAYEEKDFIDSVIDGELQKLDDLSKDQLKKVVARLIELIHFYKRSSGLY